MYKKNVCFCLNGAIWLMAMKLKNRLHRYDINRPRPKHAKYMSQYNDGYMQHLSNIWSSIHEKVNHLMHDVPKWSDTL